MPLVAAYAAMTGGEWGASSRDWPKCGAGLSLSSAHVCTPLCPVGGSCDSLCPMSDTAKRPATYAELEAVPPHLVAEIIFGDLVTHPRPVPRHATAQNALSGELTGPFQKGAGGPGGWIFMIEPELHLGPHVVVPDIAGWRRERMGGRRSWTFWSPFRDGSGSLRRVSKVRLGMPDTSSNAFVCMAAYYILQCNINGTIGFRTIKRPPKQPAAFQCNLRFCSGCAQIYPAFAYSAATLRGGSSAPESWISAT